VLDWVPTSWSAVELWHSEDPSPLNGTIRVSYDAEVTQLNVNTALDATAFTLAFPAETWVFDKTRRQSYIQRADGTTRLVAPAEKRAGYERLRSTETGEAADERIGSSPVKAAIIALNIAILAGLVVTVKRIRRSTTRVSG